MPAGCLDVSVATAQRLGGLVIDVGLNFHAGYDVDPREAATSESGMAASRPGVRGTMSLFRAAVDGLQQQVPSMKALVTDADAVLCTFATARWCPVRRTA